MKVRVIEWVDTGDWQAVEVDGELYVEGHSIDTVDWLDLLRKAGVEVTDLATHYDDGNGPARYADWLKEEAP